MRFTVCFLAVGIVGGLFPAGNALATTAKSLSTPLTATIPATCSMSQEHTISADGSTSQKGTWLFGNLSTTRGVATIKASAGFRCNAPGLTLKLSSANNWSLVREGAGAGERDRDANRIGYNISKARVEPNGKLRGQPSSNIELTVATLKGVGQRFEASDGKIFIDFTAQGFAGSGGESSSFDGDVMRLAGRYTDTVTFEITSD